MWVKLRGHGFLRANAPAGIRSQTPPGFQRTLPRGLVCVPEAQHPIRVLNGTRRCPLPRASAVWLDYAQQRLPRFFLPQFRSAGHRFRWDRQSTQQAGGHKTYPNAAPARNRLIESGETRASPVYLHHVIFKFSINCYPRSGWIVETCSTCNEKRQPG